MTRTAKPLNFPAAAPRSTDDAPDWLQPISKEAPCGHSLEYDAEYAVLLSRMTPRGEAQYGKFVGTSEAPNWAEIERDCRRMLLRTKDISLLVCLCRARARLGQAAGLAQALEVLRSTLQAWPEAIHPQLVVEGEIDPAVRANALAALADPEGLLGDVREIMVTSNTAMRLGVRDVERAFAVPRLTNVLTEDAVTQQLSALRQAAAGDARAPVHQLAKAALEAHAIDAWSRQHLGDDAPTLEPLLRVLDLFVAAETEPELEPEPVYEATVTDATTSPSNPHASHPAMPWTACGPVTTRDDVLRSIRAAREWFEMNEPSSPVAVLLKQAERMVGKRFSQVADSIPLDLLQKWENEQDAATAGGQS
jgi:type VI secretion system protein ImpA